jgi:hypothetical protein
MSIIDFFLFCSIYISDSCRTCAKMCFFSLFLKAEDIWITGDIIKRKDKIKECVLNSLCPL